LGEGEAEAVGAGEFGGVLPEVVFGDAVEDDGVRGGGDDALCDERAFAARDVGEDECAARGLAVEAVELLAGEARDDGDGVDDGVPGDAVGVAGLNFGGVDGVVEAVEGGRP